MIYDVVVVGGGPAGSYFASKLTKKGIPVLILDHSLPREKPCGGGISPFALEKFPFLEKFRPKKQSLSSFKVISGKNQQEKIREYQKGFNVSRRQLDEEILNMAIQNGAKLAKEKVLTAHKIKGFWRIVTAQSVFSAKILIGADGVNSLVRRVVKGPIPSKDLALTFGYFATGFDKTQSVLKYFNDMPGYIWIFPREDETSVGIGSDLRFGSILKQTLDRFLNSYCPEFKIKSRFASLLPSAQDPQFFQKPCSGEDWLLIGDAAGHVDPITGEGIPYALWSGRLAAEAIERKDPKSYDKSWQKEYGNSLMKRCLRKETFLLTVEPSMRSSSAS